MNVPVFLPYLIRVFFPYPYSFLLLTWLEQLICKSPTQVGVWPGWLSCQGKQAQAATSRDDLHCSLQPCSLQSTPPSVSMVVALTTTLAPRSPTSTLLVSPTCPT